MAHDYVDDTYSDWDDEMTYLREVAPERLDAILDAIDEQAALERAQHIAAAWDEAGHVIAAALCGVRMEPFVFTLLPDVDARERALIWWAGPYARSRSRCNDPYVGNTEDLGAAGGNFHRYESEAEMARQLDLAWPHICALAEQLMDGVTP